MAEHSDLWRQSPFECLNADCHPAVFKEKSPVFVARKSTERLVAEQLMVEGFSTAQRLYQYLNWTMRINKVSRTMNLLEGRSGERVLLINTELHDRRRRELYALCIPNDVISPKAQKWCFAPNPVVECGLEFDCDFSILTACLWLYFVWKSKAARRAVHGLGAEPISGHRLPPFPARSESVLAAV